MSKILILYPNYNEVITGGHIYDHYFIDRIIASKKHSVDFSSSSKYSVAKNYDVILTNSRLYPKFIFLWLALRLFSKCKLICIHHHFDFMSHQGGAQFLLRYIVENSFLLFSTGVIIPSPYVRDVFKKMFPRKKIYYSELGVKQMPVYVNDKERHSNELIFVGTVSRRKGLHFLIEALNITNKENILFNLKIVGSIREQEYYSSLKEKINKYALQDKIVFEGQVTDNELADFYSNADIFVFPSTLEGYGMVLIEAMSFGLPVITFNNSAMPYTVKDRVNGLLVKNKNIADLASKISTLLLDKELRNKLATGALQTASKTRKMSDMHTEIDEFLKDM